MACQGVFLLATASVLIVSNSGTHPISYAVGTGGPFPGDTGQLGCGTDHSCPSSAEVKNV
jgi:hypothetical protein